MRWGGDGEEGAAVRNVEGCVIQWCVPFIFMVRMIYDGEDRRGEVVAGVFLSSSFFP